MPTLSKILLSQLLIISVLVASPFLGELSLSASANGVKSQDIQIITRYLPAIEIQQSLNDSWDYDIEVRWQLSWGSFLDTLDFSETATILEPYRVALNLQNQNTEYIIGLQKINFGPARILRPLMWFDSVNPTDPLELTPGVTGVSTNHYYASGWSSRSWILLPGDPIGWEVFPDKQGAPEIGGRLTLPIGGGQAGLTTSWRKTDLSDYLPSLSEMNEWKIGLDGFWDVGIGLWFESVYKLQLADDPYLRDQVQAVVGADYTIWVGNGIHVLAEHMLLKPLSSFFADETELQFTSLMMNYSPTIIDQISLMFYMDWENEQPLAYLSWGQTYDTFRFTLGAFYTDTNRSQDSDASLNSDFSGKGLQLTVAYNH